MRLPSIDLHGHPVAPRQTLVRSGVSGYRIRTAVDTGRWQEPLPGVIVGHSGPLTRLERWRAALYFAGGAAVLSHRSALLGWGARIEEPVGRVRASGVRGSYRPPEEGGLVEVTVPHGGHLRSRGFVVVHQSRRPVARGWTVHDLPAAPPARAAVDVALTASRCQDVDHVVADVLQRGLCSVRQLEDEASLLARRLGPWLRAALGDARRGMRSVGEADLRRAILMAGVPEPEWGAAIETPLGTFFVDAFWRAQRVAVEADGAAFHLSAKAWDDDLRRQNALQSVRVTLFRYPVRRLRAEPMACGLDIGSHLAQRRP